MVVVPQNTWQQFEAPDRRLEPLCHLHDWSGCFRREPIATPSALFSGTIQTQSAAAERSSRVLSATETSLISACSICTRPASRRVGLFTCHGEHPTEESPHRANSAVASSTRRDARRKRVDRNHAPTRIARFYQLSRAAGFVPPAATGPVSEGKSLLHGMADSSSCPTG